MNIDIMVSLDKFKEKSYVLSRMIGILLDNAIEATEQADTKEMSISFSYNKKKQADMIEIKNHIKSNSKIDLNKIFDKGESSKKVKSGLGLWEVNKILKKHDNLAIFTSKDDELFKQQLEIYLPKPSLLKI